MHFFLHSNDTNYAFSISDNDIINTFTLFVKPKGSLIPSSIVGILWATKRFGAVGAIGVVAMNPWIVSILNIRAIGVVSSYGFLIVAIGVVCSYGFLIVAVGVVCSYAVWFAMIVVVSVAIGSAILLVIVSIGSSVCIGFGMVVRTSVIVTVC